MYVCMYLSHICIRVKMISKCELIYVFFLLFKISFDIINTCACVCCLSENQRCLLIKHKKCLFFNQFIDHAHVCPISKNFHISWYENIKTACICCEVHHLEHTHIHTRMCSIRYGLKESGSYHGKLLLQDLDLSPQCQ